MDPEEPTATQYKYVKEFHEAHVKSMRTILNHDEDKLNDYNEAVSEIENLPESKRKYEMMIININQPSQFLDED